MKNLKKITALLLAMLLIFSFAACGSKPAQAEGEAPMTKVEQIKAAGKLVVGTSADYPPYEFHTEINGKDEIVGFDMAFAQYIADDLGVELEIVDMGFDSLLISLQKGDFDIVLAGLTPSEERKQVVDFTDSFYTNKQIVIIRTEDADKYKTTADIADCVGGYQSGTVQEQIAHNYLADANCIGLVKFNDLIMQLKSGSLDCVFTNKLVGSAFASGNADLIVQDIDIEWDASGFAAAIQKGNEDFVEYVNGLVATVTSDGTMDKFVDEANELAGSSEE
ncbi:MAG: transporter substrate-binding domain-containing protein [Clostridia bacterium]|nr:transporter substrate-binding domain-containing protein [Clostridia bacterium]